MSSVIVMARYFSDGTFSKVSGAVCSRDEFVCVDNAESL